MSLQIKSSKSRLSSSMYFVMSLFMDCVVFCFKPPVIVSSPRCVTITCLASADRGSFTACVGPGEPQSKTDDGDQNTDSPPGCVGPDAACDEQKGHKRESHHHGNGPPGPSVSFAQQPL